MMLRFVAKSCSTPIHGPEEWSMNQPFFSSGMALCLIRELDLKHALHYLTYSKLHLYCNGNFVLSGCMSDLVRKSMLKQNVENLKLGFVGNPTLTKCMAAFSSKQIPTHQENRKNRTLRHVRVACLSLSPCLHAMSVAFRLDNEKPVVHVWTARLFRPPAGRPSRSAITGTCTCNIRLKLHVHGPHGESREIGYVNCAAEVKIGRMGKGLRCHPSFRASRAVDATTVRAAARPRQPAGGGGGNGRTLPSDCRVHVHGTYAYRAC